MENINHDNPVVVSFVRAAHSGDVEALQSLLDTYPGIAANCAVDGKGGSRTALHVVTDWSGYFPTDL